MIDILAMKRSTAPMGNRKYGGGGGGDDGGYAARQAEMKASQDTAIQSINAVFGKGDGAPIYGQDQSVSGYDTAARDKAAADRSALYSTITQDASARLLDKLGKDREVAQRGTNFQLARQGLAGGSSDIDQGRNILDKYNEGSLEAGNSALAAGNEARSADEKTRVGVINNIRQGLSQSDALSATYAGLENNANAARDSAMSTNIGGFFNDINAMNQQRQYNQGLQSARQTYGAGVTSGTAGGNNGRIFNY